MDVKQALECYDDLTGRLRAYEYALALANWDLETLAPDKSKPFTAKAIGVLSGDLYALQTSAQMKEILEAFERSRDELSPVKLREMELMNEKISRLQKIPKSDYQEYSELRSTSQFVWETAKEHSDFDLFAPYLEKVVVFARRFAQLTNPEMHPYDVCLDGFEKDMNIAQLDEFFAVIKEKTLPMVARIAREGTPIRDDFFYRSYDVRKQREITLRLIDCLGFDQEAGVLAVSEHPMTTELNEGDVRLTTRYYENNLLSAILSTVHEAGHGIYEQHAKASPIVSGSMLNTGASAGMHEAQARFYENRLCRSLGFWQYFFPVLLEAFPRQLGDVTLEEFYRGVNIAKPSLIRTEADELTYNLHVLIRYELEKALLEGSLEVRDLPRAWNDKCEEYLGIVPVNNQEGVLQDVHWAVGQFGYFPTYALGNAYAAQINNVIEKRLNLDDLCSKGDLASVGDWLNEHIHRYGMLKRPGELLEEITGEPFNPVHLANYLRDKYNAIYFQN